MLAGNALAQSCVVLTLYFGFLVNGIPFEDLLIENYPVDNNHWSEYPTEGTANLRCKRSVETGFSQEQPRRQKFAQNRFQQDLPTILEELPASNSPLQTALICAHIHSKNLRLCHGTMSWLITYNVVLFETNFNQIYHPFLKWCRKVMHPSKLYSICALRV